MKNPTPETKFSIKFKVRGKVHDLQNTFDASEETLEATLNKAYELLK